MVDTELAQQHDEIGIRPLEQLQQPVLDLDVIVRPRHAETDSPLQRALSSWC